MVSSVLQGVSEGGDDSCSRSLFLIDHPPLSILPSRPLVFLLGWLDALLVSFAWLRGSTPIELSAVLVLLVALSLILRVPLTVKCLRGV